MDMSVQRFFERKYINNLNINRPKSHPNPPAPAGSRRSISVLPPDTAFAADPRGTPPCGTG